LILGLRRRGGEEANCFRSMIEFYILETALEKFLVLFGGFTCPPPLFLEHGGTPPT
jgi:hypothetical protein